MSVRPSSSVEAKKLVSKKVLLLFSKAAGFQVCLLKAGVGFVFVSLLSGRPPNMRGTCVIICEACNNNNGDFFAKKYKKCVCCDVLVLFRLLDFIRLPSDSWLAG